MTRPTKSSFFEAKWQTAVQRGFFLGSCLILAPLVGAGSTCLESAALAQPHSADATEAAATKDAAATKSAAGTKDAASPVENKNKKTTTGSSPNTKSHHKIGTAEQAIALVKKRADVKEFFALFPKGKSSKTNGSPVIDAEMNEGKWMVHVYELMPDHTATRNWYTVDPASGSVTPMF